jgi:hypothetical protein
MSQKLLKARLPQVGQAGIFRLQSSDQGVIEKVTELLGYPCFRVDLGNCANLGEVLTAFGHDLLFPEWYGANLDALSDCLTDLSWREATGYVLCITGADTASVEDQGLAALNDVLASVVDEWRTRGVAFWVFYDSRATRHLDGLPVLK